MYSLRVSVVVLMIALITRFDQGAALKCRKCISTENKDCLDNPKEIVAIECSVGETTPKPTTNPAASSPTVPTNPTAASSPTVPTNPSTSSPTVPTNPSTAASSPTVPTNPSTAASSPTLPTNPSTAASSPTLPTDPSTAASSPTVPTNPSTAASSPTVPTNPSTAASTVPTSSNVVANMQGLFDGYNGVPEKMKYEGMMPETLQIFSRRNAPVSRADEAYTCFKLVYKDKDDKDVVQRGCASKNDKTCDSLQTGKAGSACHLCDDNDGCNASSRVSLGIMSIIVPVVLIVIFAR